MPNDGADSTDFPEKVPNPFADEMEEQPYNSDPFASPLAEGYSEKQAGHYEATGTGRGGTLLLLSIVGMFVAIFGLVPLYCCLPANLFALAFSLPAWIMAKHDLEGMDLGAIEDSDRRRTRAAKLLGIAGTALTLISIAAVIAMIALAVGSPSMLEFRNSFSP